MENLVDNRLEYTNDGVKVIGNVDLNELLSGIIAGGVKIHSINCSETTFEDYYLSVIGGAKL